MFKGIENVGDLEGFMSKNQKFKKKEYTYFEIVISKIADLLDLSLDNLVGNTDTVIEKDLLKEITDIQKLPDD